MFYRSLLFLTFLIAVIIFLLFPKNINKIEFLTYRIVLDPGHGGIRGSSRKYHGDKYDIISKKYMKDFAPGARYRNVEEHIITYEIAKKVKNLLDHTKKGNKFSKFKKLLKTFTDKNPQRIIIKSILSRIESKRRKLSYKNDPNGPFRLYDYPQKNGKIAAGRISQINSYKPHLVVSLHCDMYPPKYYRGINPVITAPHTLLYKGLKYLKGEINNKNFFHKSPYSYWFVESISRSQFKWFLKDTSVYFTGYPTYKNNNIRKNKFSGYRQNMVSWAYKDPAGWELLGKRHPYNTQYAQTHKDMVLQGRFWKREASKYEKYRREGGIEGFGGDNLYACNEIIKYILYSLNINKLRSRSQKLGKPYISTWSVPLLVNAISAYIELGYIRKKRDRYLLTKKQDEIAQGIAVGIYSLFAGLEPKNKKFRYLPKGKKLNLEKYSITREKDYFDIVAD